MRITNLAYRTEVRLLTLGGSEVSDRDDYIVVRTPANPGFWWGNYLLFPTAFGPGDAGKRVRAFQLEFPDAKHVALGVDTVDGATGTESELTSLGLEIERNVVMTASEAQLRAPARSNTEAKCRILSSDDDFSQLYDLTMAASSSDPDQVEFSRKRHDAEMALVAAGHATWFGAFDGDRLQASLGLVGDGSGLARFQNVQTHPDHRGRGLASTLVHRASTYGVRALSAQTLVMVADPEYGAIRIYRALGFSDTETQLQFTRPPD